MFQNYLIFIVYDDIITDIRETMNIELLKEKREQIIAIALKKHLLILNFYYGYYFKFSR